MNELQNMRAKKQSFEKMLPLTTFNSDMPLAERIDESEAISKSRNRRSMPLPLGIFTDDDDGAELDASMQKKWIADINK